MAQQGTVDLEGESGDTYTFNVWPIKTSFAEVACVYIYSRKINGLWDPIYVGQTIHLATRLDEHANGEDASDICIQLSGATHILVHRVSAKEDRLAEETDLRNKYPWSCNMQDD